MDELIKRLVDKMIEEISEYTWLDQFLILQKMADRLAGYSDTCLLNEYGLDKEDL